VDWRLLAKIVLMMIILAVAVVVPLRQGWSAVTGPARPAPGSNGEPVTTCDQSTLLGPDAPTPGSIAKPASLQLRPSQKASLAFGRSTSTRSRTLQFDVALGDAEQLGQYSKLAADLDPFQRDDDAELNRRMMTVNAEFRDDRVRLTLCADRGGSEYLGDPGTYNGTVSIVDARVSRVDVPFTITLAESRWPIVVVVSELTVFAGMFWIWILDRRRSGTPAKYKDWITWLLSPDGIVSCGLGLAGAATAFATLYLTSSTWAFDTPQVLALVGGVLAAFVAGSSVAVVSEYISRRFGTDSRTQETGSGAD
jgi:hypothetical protein